MLADYLKGAWCVGQAVLTAAHCVVDDNGLLNSLVVRLGEWDTQNTVEFYPHVDIDVQSVSSRLVCNYIDWIR